MPRPVCASGHVLHSGCPASGHPRGRHLGSAARAHDEPVPGGESAGRIEQVLHGSGVRRTVLEARGGRGGQPRRTRTLAHCRRMSSRLVDDPRSVAQLSDLVHDATGIPAAHVEKDFWVTETLRSVAAFGATEKIPVIFKGGTSLSRHSAIQRFSEDVDLLVILPGDAGVSARERLLKEFVTVASTALQIDGVTDPGSTSKGIRRGAHLPLPRDSFEQRVASPKACSWSSVPGVGQCRRSGGRLHPWWPSTCRMPSPTIPSRNRSVVAVMEPQRTLVEKLALLLTGPRNSGTGTRRAQGGAVP